MINVAIRKFLGALLFVGTLPSAHAQIVNIDSESLRTLLAEGVPIVDVRRQDEWEDTGVIDDSHLLTFFDNKGGYDAASWLQKFGAIAAPEKPVILICRSGSRSSIISKWLSEKQGYTTVYNVTEGMLDWKRQGGDTVAPQPVDSVSDKPSN